MVLIKLPGKTQTILQLKQLKRKFDYSQLKSTEHTNTNQEHLSLRVYLKKKSGKL